MITYAEINRAKKLLGRYRIQQGKILRQLRRSRDLTQEELGRAVGVTGQTIYHWESGARGIRSSEILQRLADYLEVSVNRLLPKGDAQDKKFKK